MVDLTKKKILVTGGAGFLGRHLVEKLTTRGVPEKNISVPRSKDCDLRLLENCEHAVKDRDIVIHLAGITGGIEFHQKKPAEIFYDNLMIGVQLMEAARVGGVQKFVSIGSATEYPENAPFPFKEENLWISFPSPVYAPYTIAKKMLSVQAAAYRQQYRFNAIHVLLTTMYGPGQKIEGNYVIPSLIRRVWEAKEKEKKSIEIWGTGKPVRDFIYVEDAAEGILAATEKYDKSEPVNIASGWGISIRELAGLITKLMNVTMELHFDTSKPDGQMKRVLDTTRAAREFGFQAATDYETGLKETIRWYEGILNK